MVLRVALQPRADADMLVIHGDLDEDHARLLAERVDEALAEGTRSFLLDLGFCRSADSRGLGALLSSCRRIAAVGGSAVAVSPAPVVRRLLWTTSIEHILPVCWSREAAIAAIATQVEISQNGGSPSGLLPSPAA